MKELKKFNVMSAGKVFGLFGLVLSILQMIVFKLLTTSSSLALQYGIDAGQLTFKFMLLGVVSASVMYFLIGVVIALIYNFVARYVGGLRFDLDEAGVAVKKVKKIKKKKK